MHVPFDGRVYVTYERYLRNFGAHPSLCAASRGSMRVLRARNRAGG
jgi:hypothetical protein